MDKKEFAEKVTRPETFTSQERIWLHAMADKYPFSSVVSTLSLLADHAHSVDTPEEQRVVALALCNNDGLDQLMDSVVIAAPEPEPEPEPVSVPEPVIVIDPVPNPVFVPEPVIIPEPVPTPKSAPKSTPKSTAKPAPKPAPKSKQKPKPKSKSKPVSTVASAPVIEEVPPVDIMNEINTFEEVSFKTAPKSVILSNFLQVGPQDAVEKAAASLRREQNDDKKSIRPNNAIGTETLAVILEKQGRYDRALAIYKNLLAQHPEKSSTFAPRIKRLESIIKGK